MKIPVTVKGDWHLICLEHVSTPWISDAEGEPINCQRAEIVLINAYIDLSRACRWGHAFIPLE